MTTQDNQRICSRCGQQKTVEEFYVRTTGRLYTWCKACHSIRIGPKPPKAPLTHRVCTRCGLDLPIDRFRKNHTYCKGCAQASVSREMVQRAQTRYRERHHAELLERWRKENKRDAGLRAENARRKRAAVPQVGRAAVRRYRDAHPGWSTVQNARRRARLLSAEGSFSRREWLELKAKYGNRCLLCHRKEPEIRLTPDHVVPLCRGGMNYITNIQPLCRGCNSRKRDQEFDFRSMFDREQ